MTGIMNENVIVKEYNFNKPPIQKIDSLTDNSIRDCHNKYFHTFDPLCEYDLLFTNITNNATVILTFSDKSLASYQLNKKLTTARRNGFIFNEKNKLTIKLYGNLSNIDIYISI